ncbi:hypothetical protein LVJ94_49305 [Pendulispora rubella]|uniref:Glyoxalase/fosfomycin resistance/dioxygenase domain-containing protein n=1 Tax=Pendulispora rubella TaxID=2741070 RepID=A0ABZ2L207_9BACT
MAPKSVYVLRVPDVAGALRFYERAFSVRVTDDSGFSVGDECDDSIHYRLVAIEQPALPLAVHERLVPMSSVTPVIEWVVDSVSEWVDRAVAAGAHLRHQSDDATYAHLMDPFGYYWALAAANEPGNTIDH